MNPDSMLADVKACFQTDQKSLQIFLAHIYEPKTLKRELIELIGVISGEGGEEGDVQGLQTSRN